MDGDTGQSNFVDKTTLVESRNSCTFTSSYYGQILRNFCARTGIKRSHLQPKVLLTQIKVIIVHEKKKNELSKILKSVPKLLVKPKARKLIEMKRKAKSAIQKGKINSETVFKVKTKKPHVCQFCNKTFAFLGNMRIHERIHTGVKPYTCKYCGKSFSQSGALNIHERIHTGIKPYECSYCSKTFSNVGAMKIHERIHTGMKPYKCQHCSKTFRQTSTLKSHQRIHNEALQISASTKHFHK